MDYNYFRYHVPSVEYEEIVWKKKSKPIVVDLDVVYLST